MTILEEIVASKKQQIRLEKQHKSHLQFESMPAFQAPVHLLSPILHMGTTSGVIAEFKRQSPSKGVINDTAQVETVTQGYRSAGAAALSVLTDEKYFGGSIEDLTKARSINNIPILRKDFIVDEWQIIEARAHGADIILLIAESLSKNEVEHFATLARSLGMDVLLEMHDEEGLKKISPDVSIVGINNRDLKTFTVDLDRSIRMLDKLPTEVARIAESGISDPATVVRLREAGFQGFLIGETFMKQDDPAEACTDFINACKPNQSA